MRRTAVTVVLAGAVLAALVAFNAYFEPTRMAAAEQRAQQEAQAQMEQGEELVAELQAEAGSEAKNDEEAAGTAAGEASGSAAQPSDESTAEATTEKDPDKLYATIEIEDGKKIELELFPERAPVTVANFTNLAKRGFYDGVKFHRVLRDFMIQGGDPQGTGRGGPGYTFKDEVHADLKFDKPGLLAMANAGPGTNGSQFFITEVPTPHLNMRHTIFGEVTDPKYVDTVKSVQQNDVMKTITIEGDTDELYEETAAYLTGWNAVLDR